MRDVLVASLVLSFLAILPALAVMVVLDKVLTYRNIATLNVVIGLIVVATIWETFLGHARRRLVNTVGTRVDVKLNAFIYARVLGLPLDYFERNQTGAIMYQVAQISKVRDFMTGKLLTHHARPCHHAGHPAAALLPGRDPDMAHHHLRRALRRRHPDLSAAAPPRLHRWNTAEMKRSTVMLETVHGIRTVKSLTLEGQQRAAYDVAAAEAAAANERLGSIGNWPDTIATVLEGIMSRGVLLVGAWMALVEGRGNLGVLMAFMMLGDRLGQPLANMARLIDDIEDVRGAMMLAANVVDQRQEVAAPGVGAPPRDPAAPSASAASTTAIPNTRSLALKEVSFDIPAGGTVGLVGRSGSGKSTITRLLQGFALGYEGDHHDRRQRAPHASTLSTCAASSAWCCRTTSCSAARSRTTSSPAAPA